jgi:hypothetical protein
MAMGQSAVPRELASLEEWTGITEPLLSSIEEEEKQNGPFSANLVDMLTRLGLTYQEYDEHALAVAVLDRALFLKRSNEGLFTMDQAPLVERLIASERELGRSASAEELEQRLLELARRHPADPRAAPIFREAAERELAHYEALLRGEVPSTLTIGLDDSQTPQGIAGTAVIRARGHYNEAMWALASRAGPTEADVEELAQLEQALTRTYYLEATTRDRWYQGVDDPLYGLGVVSYIRRANYTRSTSRAVDYAKALVELADWSLLFSRNGTALKRYAEAHALLVERDAPAIDALFPAQTPVFLPAFAPTPLEELGVAGSSGYIDVDFEVGKYGVARKVQVVAVAGDEAAAASKAIIAAINQARFRPSPGTEGVTSYRVRYSLGDGRLTPRL